MFAAPPPCSSCNYRYPLGPNITAMPSLGKDYVMHLIMGGVPTGRHTGVYCVETAWHRCCVKGLCKEKKFKTSEITMEVGGSTSNSEFLCGK